MDSEIRSKVELHYDRRANTTKGQRAASKIILLRKFQNWVKATLINTYAHEGCVVLDLACGKGGDVIKWSKARSSKYYGYGRVVDLLCMVLFTTRCLVSLFTSIISSLQTYQGPQLKQQSCAPEVYTTIRAFFSTFSIASERTSRKYFHTTCTLM